MKKILHLFAIIVLIMLVSAFPMFQIYRGSVKINGIETPIGTVIEAYIQNDNDPDVPDGDCIITKAGYYDDLTITADESYAGNTIILKINNFTADQTAKFLIGGNPAELNLTFEIPMEEYTIPLNEGWNLISLPFSFIV